MFASRLASAARPAVPRLVVARRAYATTPPPPPPSDAPPAKSGGGSTIWLVGAALGAGGLYYYYTNNPERVQSLKEKAQAEEELAKRHAKDFSNNAMAAGQDRLAAARSTVSGSIKDAKDTRDRVVADADARAHKFASDVEAKYDAKSSSENLYDDARADAEKKAADARAGWFSWLNWGTAKAEEGKEKATKEGSKAAGDVQKKLEKHT
ncbi:hypothetical protein B0H10DRAFT_2081325 [Mycena sp. CBHHK59/15]|nr:hypothetical protein B0H10DRAFT_2081325 [Mycena sp. CBHHK59/15]